MNFKDARATLKQMAKGEHHSLEMQVTTQSDGEVIKQYAVYIHRSAWHQAKSWRQAFAMLREEMFDCTQKKKWEKKMPRKIKLKVTGSNRKSCYAGGRKGVGKYCKAYNKGSIVTATPGSLGVMVFPTKRDAKQFIACTGVLNEPAKILRVLPIGKGQKIHEVSISQDEFDIDRFYKKDDFMRRPAPPGTMGYPAVEVLD